MKYLRYRYYFVSIIVFNDDPVQSMTFVGMRMRSKLKGKELLEYIRSESESMHPRCSILSINKLN